MNSTGLIFKENVDLFIKNARQLMNRGIYCDKTYMRKLEVFNVYYQMAEQFLGSDLKYLQDAGQIRSYIYEVFGERSLMFFQDDNGVIRLDLEHALFFFYYLRSVKHEFINTGLGLVYLIAGITLHEEFEAIRKSTTRNIISPKYRLEPKTFTWSKCPYILRKYMLSLTVPEGYKGYYCEFSLLASSVYLVTAGITLDDANKKLSRQQGGLLYSWLPLEIEDVLLPSITSELFLEPMMDGEMHQKYILDNKKVKETSYNAITYNVYNDVIKTSMISITGALLNEVEKEIMNNRYLSSDDCIIYHLSPQRFGIAVKEGIKLENALPTMYSRLQEVKPIDFARVLEGELC